MTFVKIIFIFLVLAYLMPTAALGQKGKDETEKPVFPLDNFYSKRKPNHVRSILKNFSFGLSTGYGNTFFSHKLDGFGVYQVGGYSPNIFASPNTNARFSNWVNTVSSDTVTSIIPRSLFIISSDSAKLGFKGNAFNIPLKATIHYEYDRYRIGGGYSYEYMNMRQFHSISYGKYIDDFRPTSPAGLMKKYFGILGVSFLRWNNLLFTGDVNVGGYKPGKNFNTSLIKKGVYANVGVTVEKEFSEYLKAFIRPSFELKNYKLNAPEVGSTINHSINAFYLNVGLSYKIPGLAKCYNKDCHVQMNHVHGDTEYRSQMHPIYKKQNPFYGENNPKLIKYKGKNRKKLSPY
jgi:hypothetical protein